MGRAELKVWPARDETFFRPRVFARKMADLLVTALVVLATFAAVLVPFLVIPEILGRNGYNSRSLFVRGIVWVSFLAIVLVPAVASGFLPSVSNLADWVLLVLALIVAVIYDYYRLNPEKVPWARART